MRLGLVLAVTDPGDPLPGLQRQAQAAEEHGFDLVWIEERHGDPADLPAPSVLAAMLAPVTSAVRVVTSLRAGVHPVYLAEEAAVADQVLGGRLVLALGAPAGAEALLAETVDVLMAASAARPFRHEGQRWRIPANLPENQFNLEERVRVTPPPAQLELPLWLIGPAAFAVAVERCLSFVTGPGDTASAADRWREAEQRLGPAVARLRRVSLCDAAARADGSVDADAMTGDLRSLQARWGADVAVLQPPDALSQGGRERFVSEIAHRVRPRVQLHRLPPGLEEFWAERERSGK